MSCTKAFFKALSLSTIGTLLLLGVSGCAPTTNLVKPSDVQGKVPPKLTFVSYWDDPAAFGKVPPELKATGDKNCQAIGAIEATGYHSKAEDAQGKPIPGGGYYCRFPTLEEAEQMEKAKKAGATAATAK